MPIGTGILAFIMYGFTYLLAVVDTIFGTDLAQNGVLYLNEFAAIAATKLAEILYKFLGIFI